MNSLFVFVLFSGLMKRERNSLEGRMIYECYEFSFDGFVIEEGFSDALRLHMIGDGNGNDCTTSCSQNCLEWRFVDGGCITLV